MMRKTEKLASFQHPATGEVRHLLMDEVRGSADTALIVLTADGEEKLFSGTEYETRQEGQKQGMAWVDEGFVWRKDNEPPYEELGPAIRLAERLGFDGVYDRRVVNMDIRKGPINATGAILLREWNGVQGKNGGVYRYAVTFNSIVAEPQLPSGFPLPKLGGPDFGKQMLKVIEAKKSVGERAEFLFTGLALVP